MSNNIEVQISADELKKRKLFVATPMYGGMNHGMYCHSMIQLTAKCLQYGIELRFYPIFNESLITRARAYCVDEFLRSDSTHLMFIDSDIGFDANDVIMLLALAGDDSEYDVIGGAYPKKCLHSSTKIHTEDGLKPVDWIIKNKYFGKVKSFNSATGVFEWKQILTHSKDKNVGKKWVGLVTKTNSEGKIKNKNAVVVTEDHEVLVTDSPRDFDFKWVRADSTLDKWIVCGVDETHQNHAERTFPVMNNEQFSALLGMAIGDGHLTKTGTFTVTHGKAQHDYTRYISDIFDVGVMRRNQNNALGVSFINPDTKYLHELMYDGKKKTMSKVIPLVDEVALAHLFMDDGNRYYRYKRHQDTGDKLWWHNTLTGETRRGPSMPDGEGWIRGRDNVDESTASLALMSFTVEENRQFLEHIKTRFGIEGFLTTQRSTYKGETKSYPLIKFNRENAKKLYQTIAKWVPECMEYKLDPDYRGGEKGVISHVYKLHSLKKIKALDYDVNKQDSHLYDIGVEDNHNMVVNSNLVVHNCISFEKVKIAVDKGFADEDPNQLERFVGDYVFNPIDTGGIPLNKPSEVMELGTGFMMIRRNTFDRFKEAYPEFAFKPDHVRSDNFDGTREIHMYFDTIIDPESKRYLSEDYFFCQWARKAGMKVWLCPWMKLVHCGTYMFGGSLADLAMIGASPTASVEQLKKPKKQ